MKSRNIILSLALMGCTAANALTLQQAKKLYSEGEFGKALSTFQGLAKKSRQRILQPMVRCLPL